MLCKRGLGWQTRFDSSCHLIKISSWKIRVCRSYVNPSAAHGKTKGYIGSNHDRRKSSSISRLPKTTFGIVTTNTPSHTTVEQLLEPLKNAQPYPGHLPASAGANALLSLLVTPSFAQHALGSQLPLKAWERLVGSSNGLAGAETVVAVVDRLPAVTTVDEQPPRIGEEREDGQEGVAYLFTTQQETEKDALQAPSKTQEELIPPLRGKPGTLTFTVPGSASPPVPNHALEMPLAQTIFATGRVSTLIRTTYTIDKEQRLQVETQQEHRSLNLKLPMRSEGNVWTVRLPLLPLTPARKVKYSMGNILRQLWHAPSQTDASSEQSADNGTAQPASQELEQAVSAYFDALGMNAQAVAVWALIVPAARPDSHDNKAASYLLQMKAEEMKKNWVARRGAAAHPDLQQRINSGVLNLIYLGAKLCRVLSGGGGWGKKAGLLSLDPDNSYSAAELGNIQPNPLRGADAGPLTEDTPSAFGQIAEAGDHVMFFLAPAGLDGAKGGAPRTIQTKHTPNDAHSTDASQAFVFGTLPSSIDSVPSTRAPSVEPKITHTPNVFGMLSEGGMALELTPATPKSRSRTAIRTKLDVPYARFNGTKETRSNLKKAVDKVSQEAPPTPEQDRDLRVSKAGSKQTSWELNTLNTPNTSAPDVSIRQRPDRIEGNNPVPHKPNGRGRLNRVRKNAMSPEQNGPPLVRTFPSLSPPILQRVWTDRPQPVELAGTRQERRNKMRAEQLWALRRTQKKAEMFKMMASSLPGDASSSERDKSLSTDESLKKSLAEDVDRFFHRR